MDGAVFESQQASGVGVLIKDHSGLVAAALSKKVYCPLGPLEAEAKALGEAMDFAWDVGIRDVHFECDSKLIVDIVLGVRLLAVLKCPSITSSQVFVRSYKHSRLHRSHTLSKQGTNQLTSWLSMPRVLSIM